MGKATWWLRRIFGLKKPGRPLPSASDSQKQRWRFVTSYREKRQSAADGDSSVAVSPYGPTAGPSPPLSRADTSKHSGAPAAPAVSRLTSARRSSGIAKAYFGAPPPREERAAVKIQAAFRAYLARRALRALKGLVKLQALVRGHMIRKHTAEYLRSIQALLRAQARARAERVQNSVSPLSSSKHSQLQCHDPVILGKYEQGTTRQKGKKHVWSSTPTRSLSKDKSHSAHSTRSDCVTDRILEVGIGCNSRRRLLFHSSHPTLSSDQNSHSLSFTTSSKSTAHQVAPNPSFDRVKSPSLLKHPDDVEDGLFLSAENSPQFFSASSGVGSSRRVPFTPTKSDSSKSYLSDCLLDHPNYMACTASSRAKVRSLSAPKQRPEFERSRSAKRNSIHGFCDSKPPRFSYANKASHSIADWRDVEFQ